MQSTQTITINVQDTPLMPDISSTSVASGSQNSASGFEYLSGSPSVPDSGIGSLWDTIIGNPVLIVAIILILTLLVFVAVVVIKKPKTITKTFPKRFLMPTLAGLSTLMPLLLAAVVLFQPGVTATSDLRIANEDLTITLFKDNSNTDDPVSKSVASTTKVTTNNPSGYTLISKLDEDLESGISVSLNDQVLTTEAVAVYTEKTGASPSIHNNTLTVTVDGDMEVGEYEFDVLYGITEIHYLSKVVEDNKITSMQNFTSALCQVAGWDHTDNGANDSNTVVLTDSRNDQEYMIRKLADGNCWMVNNLKLGSTTSDVLLTSADTNITYNWTLPQVKDDMNSSQISLEDPRVFGPVTGQSDEIGSETFYGYLYNWCAAAAGGPKTGGSDTCAALQSQVVSDAPASDICPVGWRLPTGGQQGEFAVLNGSMYVGEPSHADVSADKEHIANWKFGLNSPFKGVFSGAFGHPYGQEFTEQGTDTYLWSSTIVSSRQAYSLHFNSEKYELTEGVGGSDISHGFAIRCLVNQ